MRGADALDELAREGYLRANEAGWVRVVKVPPARDLAWFVRMIHTLGSQSTSGGDIEVTRGSAVDELLYRRLTR